MKHPRPANQAGPHHAIPSAEIRPGELWPVRLLADRLGWGSRAKAAAVKQGLRVFRWGRFSYVKTDDLIALLTRPHEKEPDQRSAGLADLHRKKSRKNGRLLPESLPTP